MCNEFHASIIIFATIYIVIYFNIMQTLNEKSTDTNVHILHNQLVTGISPKLYYLCVLTCTDTDK
jgi:hypothetical protein